MSPSAGHLFEFLSGGGAKLLTINDLQTALAEKLSIMCKHLVCLSATLFFSVFAVSVLLTSCSKNQDNENEAAEVIASEQDPAFSDFLSSLDELNDSFGYVETKGIGRDIIKHGADVGGAYIGKTLGVAAGGAVGIASGSPLCGAFVGKALTGALGVGFFVGASYLAESIYDKFSGEYGSIDDPLFQQVYDYTHQQHKFDLTEDSSCGEIHNAILAALMSNGKSYFDEAGNIDVEQVYRDIFQIEESLGIYDEMNYDPQFCSIMRDYCEDAMDAAKDLALGKESTDSYFDRIYGSVQKYGVIPSEDIIEVRMMVEKLKAPVVLSDEETFAYERAFEESVAASDLPDLKKETFRTVGSVAIMSTEFWY